MNNSRILTIKNANISGYYFYMNFNIWEDFQICISIPLMFLKLFWKSWKNFRSSFVMEFLFRKLRPINYRLQLFVFVKFWKIPAIKITLELLSALLSNSCLKQLSGKFPGRSATARKKDSTWIYYWKVSKIFVMLCFKNKLPYTNKVKKKSK